MIRSHAPYLKMRRNRDENKMRQRKQPRLVGSFRETSSRSWKFLLEWWDVIPVVFMKFNYLHVSVVRDHLLGVSALRRE